MPTGFRRSISVERRVERQDLGVNGQLAQAARDQLRELRAEIENNDSLMSHEFRVFGRRRGRGKRPKHLIIECASGEHHNIL